MEFDELLGHLDDLIDLARSEDFYTFAAALARERAQIRQARRLYAYREPSSAPAIDPARCGDRSPSGLECAGPPNHGGSHGALDDKGQIVMWDRDSVHLALTFPVISRVFYGR